MGEALSLLVVAGATASGKTELSLALARELGGELVSADSRQVYRGLDAGTAKPPRDASGLAAGVPVHLLDVADPAEFYDAGRFAAAARDAIADIRARGRLPILAGGTGLYLRALLDGLSPLPRRNDGVRRRLLGEAARDGRLALHERLDAVDPESARRIPPGNLQRVVRALEVWELTGRPLSRLWAEAPPRGLPAEGRRTLLIEWPAAALRERIAARALSMWPGMLAEARALLAAGLTGAEPGLQSLGYPEALACARGELAPEEGLRRLIASTAAYAKRQRTWLRHQLRADAVIAGGSPSEMLRQALAVLPS